MVEPERENCYSTRAACITLIESEHAELTLEGSQATQDTEKNQGIVAQVLKEKSDSRQMMRIRAQLT